jgi:hypothetical protein
VKSIILSLAPLGAEGRGGTEFASKRIYRACDGKGFQLTISLRRCIYIGCGITLEYSAYIVASVKRIWVTIPAIN